MLKIDLADNKKPGLCFQNSFPSRTHIRHIKTTCSCQLKDSLIKINIILHGNLISPLSMKEWTLFVIDIFASKEPLQLN